jgi:hypothetical protein
VQVDVSWQNPATPLTLHVPYVQHWMPAGPGQSPDVEAPPEQRDDGWQTPGILPTEQ